MTLTAGNLVLANPLLCTNIAKGDNKLYSDAKGVVPSLDLRFASQKNLNDYMTGTPLVDHQRSMNSSTFSPGTFVNSNGLIETAKANYALYSETLTASWWSGGQFISISDTTDVNPPTGIQNIYKVTETADTGEHFFRGSQVNLAVTAGVPNGTVVTISIYLNTSLGRSKVRVYSFGQNNLTFIWDLVNNAQIGTISGGTSPTINSQSLGNNWYRFSFTDTATTSSNLRPVFQTVNNLNQFNYAGDTTKGFYASGFQVEIGTTATTYIPTTTVPSAAPRFDHNPTTGESLGLLVEESRTNNLKTSNDFSGWLLSNITNNVSTQLSPDGSFNAAEFETTGNSANYPYNGKPGTQLPAGTYTFSVWTKFEISSSVLIYGSNLGALLLFDAATKQPSTATIQQGASSFVGTVEEYPNGWYRLSATIIVNSGSLVTEATVALNKNKVTTYGLPDASGVGDVLTIWGAQLEEGSFPTSYIPTSGTALTRSADTASITGTNFSSWFVQNNGSFYCKADLQSPASGGQAPIFSVDNSGANFRAASRRVNSGVRITTATDGIDITSPSAWNGEIKEFSLTWVANDCALVDSGTLIGIDTSTVNPLSTVNQLLIGNVNSGGFLTRMGGHIARLTYFPDRLPDATLQVITAT